MPHGGLYLPHGFSAYMLTLFHIALHSGTICPFFLYKSAIYRVALVELFTHPMLRSPSRYVALGVAGCPALHCVGVLATSRLPSAAGWPVARLWVTAFPLLLCAYGFWPGGAPIHTRLPYSTQSIHAILSIL